APSASGLFARAIPQSGAAHNLHTPETATAAARHLLETLGATAADAARVLREIPAEKLRDAQAQASLSLGTRLGLLPFQPVADGDFFPKPPLEAVRDGLSARVGLMIGTTRDEWKLFGFLDPSIQGLDHAGLARRLSAHAPDAAALVETYRKAHEAEGLPTEARELYFAVETDRVFRIPANRLAEAHHAHGAPVYFYRYDWEAGFGDGMLGACHAVELPFVFGAVGDEGAEFFAAVGPAAERMAELTMDAWLAFARSGDPSHAGLPGGRFEPWDPERRATLLFGRDVRRDDDPGGAQREAWEGVL
ncbi:MAG TPA: carboxylesterase family protein, partial [Myxococcota bacterium]|nr:carboxylesterase family protein [Myxococcota bacterium]